MIDRHNILDLLGGDKRKYHSCIITCYSFDFIFFEQRVLPKLRHAGITNVNIYVDAHQFEKQLNQFIGNDLAALVLGDNIFHGHEFANLVQDANRQTDCVLPGLHVVEGTGSCFAQCLLRHDRCGCKGSGGSQLRSILKPKQAGHTNGQFDLWFVRSRLQRFP